LDNLGRYSRRVQFVALGFDKLGLDVHLVDQQLLHKFVLKIVVIVLNLKVKRFFDAVCSRAYTHYIVSESNWLSFFVRSALLTSVDSRPGSVYSGLLLDTNILLHSGALRLLVAKLLEGLVNFKLAPVWNFLGLRQVSEVVFLNLNFHIVHVVSCITFT